MSIHNMKEVPEGETHEAKNGTRDRFGKTHPLSNEDGTSRIRSRKQRFVMLVVTVLLGSFYFAAAHADGENAAPAKRSTDIQVVTEGLDANSWLNQKYNKPEDKFGIPISEDTTVGFNDDGDQNVGMRF